MFDLQAPAFQAEATPVSAFKMGRDTSNQPVRSPLTTFQEAAASGGNRRFFGRSDFGSDSIYGVC